MFTCIASLLKAACVCVCACMCNRCERASCVCACLYACVTCLREAELPACDMYVRACMDACVTCLREAELPACHVCVRVWMRALPAWGRQNCQPVMCMCLYGCMCAFFNLLEGERTARLWYVCVRACMYACITRLRKGELPACDVAIRTELEVKQDVSFIQVISGVGTVRPTAPEIHSWKRKQRHKG